MDMKEYIAKSKPVQSIAEHTSDLLKGFDSFFSIYSEHFNGEQKELIRIACEYHDYGKAIYPFQRKICKNIGIKTQLPIQHKNELDNLYKIIPNSENIPHGYLSPAFLDIVSLENKYGELSEFCLLLIFSIFYHHERDFKYNETDFKNIIKQDLRFDITKTYYLEYISMANKLKDTEFWLKFSIIKGLLNKFDYHASSRSDSPVEFLTYFNKRCIADNVRNSYENLRPVQEYMSDNSDKNLIVTASTGIGKTEAALLWSNGSKTFYTLPLKVSINAIYDRIRKNYTNDTHGVTLLHSDSLSYLTEHESNEDNNDLAIQKYKDSRLLSYPFIVCTIDQLFAFTYKAAGSEILLATLKYSKLIIDEIQSYSSEITAKILYGLKLICDVGGKFAIITATMPPVFEYFIRELKIPYEKPQFPFYSAVMKHHRIKYIKSDIDIELIKSQGKTKKVLVICNTVKKAQEIYSKIIEEEKDINVNLLHSQFIQRHRSILESRIMAFSKDKAITGIWITTQIVEASLDIDFDLLVTEMCPGDSLLQRMGRCHRNREDEYTDSEPNVLIYDTGNGYGTVYRHKEIYDLSVNELMRYDGEIFTEEDKSAYINSIYNVDTLRETEYFKEIKKKINDMEKIIPRYYSLERAKEQIRDIHSVTVIPDSLYLEANKYGDVSDDELRTLTLSLYPYSKKAKLRDTISIRKNLDIYRILLKYEFDEETCKGEGLCDGEDFEVQGNFL